MEKETNLLISSPHCTKNGNKQKIKNPNSRSNTFVLGILLSFCLYGCKGSGDNSNDAGTDGAAETPGNLGLDSHDTASGIVGTLNSHGVRFTSRLDPETGVATATISTEDGAALVESEVVSRDEGSIRIGDVVIDGFGALSSSEAAALSQLAANDSVRSLALIPLELGCLDTDADTAQQRAALLLPWQILIKYEPSFGDVTAIAVDSSCHYFSEQHNPEQMTTHGGLQLASEDPIPNLFGFFPLDAEGSVQLKDHIGGPCEAGCRGVCGPDCPSPPCTIETTVLSCEGIEGEYTGRADVRTEYKDCGSHAGCREHDACYDECNESWDCKGWLAAICRRGCDKAASDTHGIINGVSWINGGGPFDSTLSFTHEGLTDSVPCCQCANMGAYPESECPPFFPTSDGIWVRDDEKSQIEVRESIWTKYNCGYNPPAEANPRSARYESAWFEVKVYPVDCGWPCEQIRDGTSYNGELVWSETHLVWAIFVWNIYKEGSTTEYDDAYSAPEPFQGDALRFAHTLVEHAESISLPCY